jgi:hypothetical protein
MDYYDAQRLQEKMWMLRYQLRWEKAKYNYLKWGMYLVALAGIVCLWQANWICFLSDCVLVWLCWYWQKVQYKKTVQLTKQITAYDETR